MCVYVYIYIYAYAHAKALSRASWAALPGFDGLVPMLDRFKGLRLWFLQGRYEGFIMVFGMGVYGFSQSAGAFRFRFSAQVGTMKRLSVRLPQ